MAFEIHQPPPASELLLSIEPHRLPVWPYADVDQIALREALSLQEESSRRSLSRFSVRIISSTIDVIPSIRWIAAMTETGRFFQALADQDIIPPSRLELLNPVHQAAAANDTDVETAAAIGDQLFKLADEFFHTFFNRNNHLVVPPRVLLRDTPEDVNRLRHLAEEILLPQIDSIPEEVKAALSTKADKHSNHNGQDQLTLALIYLLGHLDSWGETDALGVFPSDADLLCFAPHSEADFFAMIDQIKPFINVLPPSQRQIIRLIHTSIRHAHYLRPEITKTIKGHTRLVTEASLSDISARSGFPAPKPNRLSGVPPLQTEQIVAIQVIEDMLTRTLAPNSTDPREIRRAVDKGKSTIIKLLQKHGFKPPPPDSTSSFGIYNY